MTAGRVLPPAGVHLQKAGLGSLMVSFKQNLSPGPSLPAGRHALYIIPAVRHRLTNFRLLKKPATTRHRFIVGYMKGLL